MHIILGLSQFFDTVASEVVESSVISLSFDQGIVLIPDTLWRISYRDFSAFELEPKKAQHRLTIIEEEKTVLRGQFHQNFTRSFCARRFTLILLGHGVGHTA